MMEDIDIISVDKDSFYQMRLPLKEIEAEYIRNSKIRNLVNIYYKDQEFKIWKNAAIIQFFNILGLSKNEMRKASEKERDRKLKKAINKFEGKNDIICSVHVSKSKNHNIWRIVTSKYTPIPVAEARKQFEISLDEAGVEFEMFETFKTSRRRYYKYRIKNLPEEYHESWNKSYGPALLLIVGFQGNASVQVKGALLINESFVFNSSEEYARIIHVGKHQKIIQKLKKSIIDYLEDAERYKNLFDNTDIKIKRRDFMEDYPLYVKSKLRKIIDSKDTVWNIVNACCKVADDLKRTKCHMKLTLTSDAFKLLKKYNG